MINDNYFILITVLLSLGTLFIRGCFIAYSAKIKIPPQIKELFTFIPAAIFPALIIPSAFFHQGVVNSVFGKERFLILIISSIFCFFVRSTFLVILFGMTLLYTVTQL